MGSKADREHILHLELLESCASGITSNLSFFAFQMFYLGLLVIAIRLLYSSHVHLQGAETLKYEIDCKWNKTVGMMRNMHACIGIGEQDRRTEAELERGLGQDSSIPSASVAAVVEGCCCAADLSSVASVESRSTGCSGEFLWLPSDPSPLPSV